MHKTNNNKLREFVRAVVSRFVSSTSTDRPTSAEATQPGPSTTEQNVFVLFNSIQIGRRQPHSEFSSREIQLLKLNSKFLLSFVASSLEKISSFTPVTVRCGAG